MGIVINVFYREKEEEKDFIQKLLDINFPHFVDSVRINDQAWISENTQDATIYCIQSYGQNPEDVYNSAFFIRNPNFEDIQNSVLCVLISHKPDVDLKQWQYECQNFLEDLHCRDHTEIEYYRNLFEFSQPCVEKEKQIEEIQNSGKRKIEDLNKEITTSNQADPKYSFTFKIIDELDVCFYQVTKPNTDRPYIVQTLEFSRRGHVRFFSSMFKFPTYGSISSGIDKDGNEDKSKGVVVYPADHAFLCHIWEKLGLNGTPDLQLLLELHIEACLNGEPEPNVWRAGLDETIENFLIKSNKTN